MGFLQNAALRELANGVRYCVLPRDTAAVELQVHVATGSIHEGRFLGCGLSHFLEHMAFQGCRGFPGHAVADTVNVLGGEVNAYTTYDRTCYRMQLPAAHWRRGLEMLAAMVRFPTLPAARFETEREVILRECERGADNPDSRLFDSFMRRMFLVHPLRHPVIGYREMIAGVSREMALEYHRARYTPERCVIAVTGAADPAAAAAAIAELFGDWERRELAEMPLPDEPLPAASRSEHTVFPDPASRVMCGVRAPGFGAPELPAVELLFGVLGAGEGSLLNRKLVLESGLGLGIRGACYSFGGCSVAVVSGKCEPKDTERFAAALREELSAVAAGNIDPAAVEREKGQRYADHLRDMRDNVALAGEIASGVLYAGNPAAGEVYLEDLRRTDPAELRRVAAKYLADEAWVRILQQPALPAVKSVGSGGSRELSAETLADGGKLLWTADPTVPLVDFLLVLPGGAVGETAARHGLGKLTAAALFSGSDGLAENEILDRLDAAGVELDVTSGLNSFTLEFSVPRRNADAAVELIAEVLAAPKFPASAWERERTRQLNLLRERETTPIKCALDAATRMLYGGHPYANGGFGTEESLRGLTPAMGAAEFRRSCYAPAAVWGVGGDCTHGEAERWCRLLRQALPWSASAPRRVAPPHFSAETKLVELTLPREQAAVMRVVPGFSCRTAPELADVADILFQAENGLGSRLFNTIREQNALSYAVGMTYAAGFHPGYLAFYALTTNRSGKKALGLLNAELLRLAESGLTPAEFNAAGSAAAFEAEKALDTAESRLRTAAMDVFYGQPAERLLTRPRMLRELTLDEVNSGLRRLFAAPAGVEALILGREG